MALASQLVQVLDRASLRRIVAMTGHAANGLTDVDSLAFRLLHIEPAPRDLTVADAQDRYAALLEGRTILLGPVPDPLTPLRFRHNRNPDEFGAKVRDALKEPRPVLTNLVAPGERSSGMSGLLTSVIGTKAGDVRLDVMGVDRV
jgi:hypothetical protein